MADFSKGLQRKTSKRLHRKISVRDFSERLLNDSRRRFQRETGERQCRVDCLLTWLLLGAPWNLTESYPTNCGYTVPLPACCWRLLNLPFLLYFPASDICSKYCSENLIKTDVLVKWGWSHTSSSPITSLGKHFSLGFSAWGVTAGECVCKRNRKAV